MNFEKIKPCPFCGSTAEIVEGYDENYPQVYSVVCDSCDAKGPMDFDKKEAIKKWNIRK